MLQNLIDIVSLLVFVVPCIVVLYSMAVETIIEFRKEWQRGGIGIRTGTMLLSANGY